MYPALINSAFRFNTTASLLHMSASGHITLPLNMHSRDFYSRQCETRMGRIARPGRQHMIARETWWSKDHFLCGAVELEVYFSKFGSLSGLKYGEAHLVILFAFVISKKPFQLAN